MINEISKQWCDRLYKNKIYNIDEYNECINIDKTDKSQTNITTDETQNKTSSIEEKLIFDLTNRLDMKYKYILEKDYINKITDKIEKTYNILAKKIIGIMDKTNDEYKQRVALILTNKVNCDGYINEYENCKKSSSCKAKENLTYLQEYGTNKACIKFDDNDNMIIPDVEDDNKTLIDKNYYGKLNTETLKICDTNTICNKLKENDEYNYVVQYINDITPDDIDKIRNHTPFNKRDVNEFNKLVEKLKAKHIDKLKKRQIELNILIDKSTNDYTDTDFEIYKSFVKLNDDINKITLNISDNTNTIKNISNNIAELNKNIDETKNKLKSQTENIDILIMNKKITETENGKNNIEKYIYMIISGSSSLLILFLIYKML